MDELTVLLDPCVSGDPAATSLVYLPEGWPGGETRLKLIQIECLDDGAIWLRYEVCA